MDWNTSAFILMAIPNSCVVYCYFFMKLAAPMGASMAAHYNIGDSKGWTAAGTVDYASWAARNNFYIGDELDFLCAHQFRNVMEVSGRDFESCNSTSPVLTFTTGHDAVELTSSGHHYFLCSIPGHCQAGQKIDILVRESTCACAPATSPPDSSGGAPLAWLLSTKLGMLLVLACILRDYS